MLAGDLLHRAATRFPDKPALIEGERVLDFAAFDRTVDRAALALAASGLAKGDVAAVLSPNGIDYAVANFAAARAGIALAHLPTRATSKDWAYMLRLVGARWLAFAPDLAGPALAAAADAPTVATKVAFAAQSIGDAIPWPGFLAHGGDTPPPVAIAPEDPLGLTFTGGTTGFPKAVLVSHRARYASAVAAGVEFGLDERDVAAIAAPMFHAAGLYVWFHPVVMLGCTSVFVPRWDAEIFMTAVERRGVTAAFLVPTQLGDLVGHARFAAARLASLRHIGYAGAPMPLALYDRLHEALPNVELVENYGQSETGPMTVRRGFHPHDKRGTVGRPAHNVETKVLRGDGSECTVGETGEIATRGEHLFTAYFGDAAATRAAFAPGGWLKTGDLGRRDAEGFIALVDRIKDMIVTGGENVYPVEIENVLYRHPSVAECAVFGVPDERWGESPIAAVVLRPGATATAEELIAFVSGEIARWKRPREIAFMDRLPRTAAGKVQKALLREPYWRGRERKI